MRAVKAKALRRAAAKAYPKGSRLTRVKGSTLYWMGARRMYQDSKRKQGVFA